MSTKPRVRPTVKPAPQVEPYRKPAFEPERVCPAQIERFAP